MNLSDIGKPVLVRGESGYVLTAVSHSPGGLVATVVDHNLGDATPQHFMLEAVSPQIIFNKPQNNA